MSTHNICFYGDIKNISQNYHQIFLLNKSSVTEQTETFSILLIFDCHKEFGMEL